MRSEDLAEVISLVFNAPILAWAAFLVLLLSGERSNLPALIVITFVFGTGIPLALVFLLARRGIIPDIYASQRETRSVPFMGAILSYLIGSIALVLVGAAPIITALMLCYLGNSLIMTFLSRKWKISIHASGVTGPATVLFHSIGFLAIALLVLIFPVGWARIRLKAHTPREVIAGAVLTIVATWIQLHVYLTIL